MTTAIARVAVPFLAAAAALWAVACVPQVPGPQAFQTSAAGADAIVDGAAEVDTPVGTDTAPSDTAPSDAAGADTLDSDTAGTDAIGDTVDGTDTAAGTDAAADTPADSGCQNAGQCPAATGPCQTAVCLSGSCTVTASADGSPCSDGIECTKNDSCAAGKCVFGTNTCQCLKDADCANKEDGNFCNGTLYCDTVSHTCLTNPATAVSCPSVDDTDCVKNTCQPKTGICQLSSVKDNTACDDGDECTLSEVCKAGSCVSPASKCACKVNADCIAQDDKNQCNGTLYCDVLSGSCKTNPATVVTCAGDDTACTKNTCDPATGQCQPKPVPDNLSCDDGNPCTAPGSCKLGQCIQGADICPCSIDSDCAKLEDGNLCNGKLYCDKVGQQCRVNPNTVILCPTVNDGPCKSNQCQPKTGTCLMVLATAKIVCDADGNPCTAGDYCSGGACLPGAAICLCSSDDDCTAKEDGDLCNGTLYCDVPTGSCKVNPSTVQTCSTVGDTACTKTVCDPKTKGCVKKLSGDNALCEDGNPCTSGDNCQAGTCKSGTNLCACKVDSDCLDDGNACNGLPFCDTAAQPAQCKVKPNSAVTCGTDKSGCIVQTCVPKTGLCGPGPGLCDDGNPCTVDQCDVIKGNCQSLPAIDGSPCGGGQVCASAKCVAVVGDMALVPGGQTWLGCTAADPQCAGAEQPQHLVKLPAYWIDRFEVTAAQYKACVEAGSCAAPSLSDPACNWSNPVRVKHPINCIGWSAAQSYCTWAGKRLATEAEWEMAARGPCTSSDASQCLMELKPFPWGVKPATCAQTVMADPVTGSGCGLGTTAVAGIQTADTSPVGVRDLGGNVSEWVLDTWDAGFYASSPVTSPVNTAAGDSKVVRGGSYVSPKAKVRSAFRQSGAADAASAAVGVRCAKDAK